MNRLANMTESQRRVAGATLFFAGFVAIAIGVVVAHYANFPETVFIDGVDVPVDVDYLGWIPRHFAVVTLGQIVAIGGSQLIVVACLLLWVIGKPMTWARASFVSLIAWFELVVFFGIIPSEWLNLAQGPLGWTPQKAVALPRWLVLNNEVSISLAVVKDAISGGYHMVMLGAAIVFAYKIQDFGKGGPTTEVPKVSPYGRPLTRVVKSEPEQ